MKNLLVTLAIVFTTSVSAFAEGNSASKGTILVVVSSENQLPLQNGKTYPTGYYLNELSVPTQHFAESGYDLVFADPKGNTPTMDVRSDDVKYFGGNQAKYAEVKAFHDSLKGLQNPLSLKEVISGGLDKYAGIFIPGGHAPMIDLMASSELGTILKYFHQHTKPTAIICHGPMSLVSAVDDPVAFQQALISGNLATAQTLAKGWIYQGYALTVFSSTEETLASGNLGGQVQFLVESALQTAGAKVTVAQQWTSNVVSDRELITGQNPYSDEELSRQMLKKLAE